ncbi:hypothetical protein N7G274_010065 [Stereocaulon virgatum]|uniref:Uncharacterized protein n=1 Tax=Stereocaulon virgatum TaxID=373712 RepID=A0ABR3ZYQ2_9LECA
MGKETALEEMAAVEMTQCKAVVQAAETDKQVLQQEVQTLQCTLDLLRHTMSQSGDDFLNRIQLNLNLPTGAETEQPKGPLGWCNNFGQAENR